MQILPHVYSSSKMSQGNVVSQFGSKYMLPIGTSRETYEVLYISVPKYQGIDDLFTGI